MTHRVLLVFVAIFVLIQTSAPAAKPWYGSALHFCGTAVAATARTAIRPVLRRMNLAMDPKLRLDNRNRFSIEITDPHAPGFRILDRTVDALRYPMGIERISRAFRLFGDRPADEDVFLRFMLAARINPVYDPARVRQIPREKGLVLIANHPLFGMESLAIAAVVRSQVRSDVKILLNQTFRGLAPFDPHFIYVNPFNPESEENRRGLREAMTWVKKGGALLIHPSGAISDRWDANFGRYVDQPWIVPGLTGVLSQAENFVPIFVEGNATPNFMRIRRTIGEQASLFFIPSEVARLFANDLNLHFGTPQGVDSLPKKSEGQSSKDHRDATVQYLREMLYHLAP